MLKDEIEQDVLTFFDKIEGLAYRDKLEMLRMVLSKYALLSKSDCMLEKADLFAISSHAKKNMAQDQSQVHLGERCHKLNFDEIRMMCITKAVVAVLNGKECFKRMPKFDIREDKYPEE